MRKSTISRLVMSDNYLRPFVSHVSGPNRVVPLSDVPDPTEFALIVNANDVTEAVKQITHPVFTPTVGIVNFY